MFFLGKKKCLKHFFRIIRNNFLNYFSISRDLKFILNLIIFVIDIRNPYKLFIIIALMNLDYDEWEDRFNFNHLIHFARGFNFCSEETYYKRYFNDGN